MELLEWICSFIILIESLIAKFRVRPTGLCLAFRLGYMYVCGLGLVVVLSHLFVEIIWSINYYRELTASSGGWSEFFHLSAEPFIQKIRFGFGLCCLAKENKLIDSVADIPSTRADPTTQRYIRRGLRWYRWTLIKKNYYFYKIQDIERISLRSKLMFDNVIIVHFNWNKNTPDEKRKWLPSSNPHRSCPTENPMECIQKRNNVS